MNTERLRTGLDEKIEREREAMRGDHGREARAWEDKLAEADRKRVRYQDMAADGLIDFDELRTNLAVLRGSRDR